MDVCYICGKIITLDQLKHVEVVWKKEKTFMSILVNVRNNLINK